MTADTLETHVTLVNEKIRFSGTARENPEVMMDYFPPAGGGEGYTGLEMLLLSLSGCSATAVKVLLGKMNKTVTGLTVRASGTRQEELPRAFSSITLWFEVTSPDVTEEELLKAIGLAEASVCPVWAMLKGNVAITTDSIVHKQ